MLENIHIYWNHLAILAAYMLPPLHSSGFHQPVTQTPWMELGKSSPLRGSPSSLTTGMSLKNGNLLRRSARAAISSSTMMSTPPFPFLWKEKKSRERGILWSKELVPVWMWESKPRQNLDVRDSRGYLLFFLLKEVWCSARPSRTSQLQSWGHCLQSRERGVKVSKVCSKAANIVVQCMPGKI